MIVRNPASGCGSGASPVTFEDLARLPVVRSFAEAFAKTTGVSLTLVPPNDPDQRLRLEFAENGFCKLVAGGPPGSEACLDCHAQLLRDAAGELVTKQIQCFAGLTMIAVPVVIGGRHAATWLGGQVLRGAPTHRDFARAAPGLGGQLAGKWRERASKAYFRTPVVTAEQLQAIIQLVYAFTQTLADYASNRMTAFPADEPPAVTGAKQYVGDHIEEPISLDQVAQRVHVSRFYFCKLFKKSTGMTLTDYISRVRVDKAMALLAIPSLRISEVVFAAGFGSIPRFNAVFKRHTGMSPSDYRAGLVQSLPAGRDL